MRDLKSYFRSNVLNGSTNSPKNHDDVGSDANFLPSTHADHKRCEDDSIVAQSKRRRSSRTTSLRKPIEDSSSENESTDESNTRKKRKRKSTVEKSDPGTRVLKNVAIKDCVKSSSTSRVGSRKRACKRRQNKSDQSEPEHTDSSDDLFENHLKERPKRTYSRKSVSNEAKEVKEANNLFNYFVKAEKATAKNDSRLQDSPVDCLKRVKVVAQVHSPPRDRSEKVNKRTVKNNLSPIVMLRRARVAKNLNLDHIEVVETENITPPKTNPKSKREDSDSEVLKNARRARVSIKRLVLEDSDEQSESEKDSPEANGSPVCDTEDSVWRMRVQFAPKTAAPSGPKKPKSRITNENTSGEEEEEEEEEVEEKKSGSKPAERRILCRNRSKQKEPLKQQKLAPLFCKQQQKKTDNVVNVCDEARKLFLHSGLPEVIKKKFEEQKNVAAADEEPFTCYKFPAITHVQQKSDNIVWNLSQIDLRLKPVVEDGIVTNCQPFVSFINVNSKAVSNCVEKENLDLKDEIAMLKKQDLSTYSSVQRLYKEAEKGDTICWTDKYKPSNCGDLVGNALNLTKLRDWIESHKRMKVVHSDYDSSEEEFVDSDDSGRHSNMKDNLAILAGPSGCGKTCAVYMLAKELGFEVLEVNAASNRDGKRLLDELLEATQSHRVKRATIFEKAAEDKPSHKKRKKKKSREEKRERKTMSLILIEDADILFENYDEGFVSALNTLARESKRPLILTVNKINCPHLDRYRHNLILHFEYPTRASINAWLKVIALTEGVKLSDAALVDLFHIAGLDVRKNLLQLQMLISSKLCHSTLDGEKLFYQDWCRRVMQGEKRQTLPVTLSESKNNDDDDDDDDDDVFSPKKGAAIIAAPEETHGEESSACEPSEISHSDRERNAQLLDDHAKLMCSVTLLGHFNRNPDGNVLPGASDASHEDPLSADIISFLKQKVFSNFDNSKSSVSFGEYYRPINKHSEIGRVYQNVLSNLSVPLDRHAKYCDFLPTLRTITRVEQTKQRNQQRRTSRYFSYLKSVNIHIDDQEVKFLRESMI